MSTVREAQKNIRKTTPFSWVCYYVKIMRQKYRVHQGFRLPTGVKFRRREQSAWLNFPNSCV